MMKPVTLFLSYAHKDEALRRELEVHLSGLQREGLISAWHDRQINPGTDWRHDIDEHLNKASIILLLVSADFLNSDYCYQIEMQRALEYQQRGQARVIPIILRPCDWHSAKFAHLQCLPDNGAAITSWVNRDEAFLNVVKGLRRTIRHLHFSMRPLPEVEQKSRKRLLKLVGETWIDGFLKKAMNQDARIELRLQDRPDMLEDRWQQQVQELAQTPELLPDEATIVQVYDDSAGGELLILGEPGAGKTIVFLELTRTLLKQAEEDEQLRVPIVFHLSSWAQEKKDFATWLVEELKTKYDVPRKIGQGWIDADQVLPMLDGLDEVAKDARDACVQAINTYYQSRLEKSGDSPIVICCRSKEYSELPTRLMLHRAVSIQPLTNKQIYAYLEKAGEQVEVLRQALKSDVKLRELSRQPLMLNTFTLAYQGEISTKGLTGKTREEMQRIIFDRYAERMLYRREQSKRWKPEQMIHYLTFLAKQMQQSHQTDFSVDNLQPTWLLKGRWFYQLCVELLWVHCGGLFIGFIGWLLGGWFLGFYEWLYFGLMLVILSLEQISLEIYLKQMLVFSWKKVGYTLAYSIMASMLFGLLGIPMGWLLGWLLGWRVEEQHMRGIHSKEKFAWSWKKAGSMFLASLITGPGFWLAVRLHSGLFTNIVFELSVGLVYGGVTGIFGSLLFGFSGRQLPEHLSSNDGIWRSGRNGLFFGVVGGLVGGLLSGPLGSSFSAPTISNLAGPLGGLISPLVAGWGAGLLSIVVFGLLGGLIDVPIFGWRFGLDAFVKHFLLRFLLWYSGSLPWRLFPFLDEAVERLFLYKAGKNYIFVHRMLLDYFSKLDDHIYSEIKTSNKKTQKYDTNIQR